MPSNLIHCTCKCQRIGNTRGASITSWDRGVRHERLQVRFPLLRRAHDVHFSCGSLIQPCLYDFPTERHRFRCVDNGQGVQSFDVVVLIDLCDVIQKLCRCFVEKSEIPTRSIDHDTMLFDTTCMFSGKRNQIRDRTLRVVDMISHQRFQRCLFIHLLDRTRCTHVFEHYCASLKIRTRNSDRMSRSDDFRITFEYVVQSCLCVSQSFDIIFQRPADRFTHGLNR